MVQNVFMAEVRKPSSNYYKTNRFDLFFLSSIFESLIICKTFGGTLASIGSYIPFGNIFLQQANSEIYGWLAHKLVCL